MGTGLATSAGLNAYIPLLIIGLLAKYTDFIDLPGPWEWLQNDSVLVILGVLLVIEIVADKVPVVDHINDVVQTVIRPTAGGLAFGAAASSDASGLMSAPAAVAESDPGLLGDNSWIAIGAGMVISFIVHVMKALARPLVNMTTAGLGAPVASATEDAFSIATSFVAILLPFLIIIPIIGLIWFLVAMRRRRKRRKAQQQTTAAVS
jgi:hypothetical protein